MKRAILAIAISLIVTGASAQSQTFYDSNGRIVGRSLTDSGGATTVYDSNGRVVGRSSRDENQTTVYDSRGFWRGKIRNER